MPASPVIPPIRKLPTRRRTLPLNTISRTSSLEKPLPVAAERTGVEA
jgi:hypothetical protein